MHPLLRIPVLVVVAAWAAAAQAAMPDPADLVKARLVPETAAVVPGSTLWLDLHFDIKPGWHTYWRDPGDAGAPTTIEWHLPPEFGVGPGLWPVPTRFVESGIGTYGYVGQADLLVPITVPKGLAAGADTKLAGTASWLVCAEICIPGSAELSLALPVADSAAPDPAAAPLFAEARRRLPVAAPFEARFAAEDKDYRLFVPQLALAGLDRPKAAFYPLNGSVLDNAAVPELRRRPDGIELVLARPAQAPPMPPTLDGVLVLSGAGGVERAFAISAGPAPAPADGLPWSEALLLAFLGGVILNAMPCVFPILSLKLLGLAQQAHGHRAEQLAHGFAYTAGVTASFAALGGLMLLLRAGGQAVGWGFQLQSPILVAVLAYLLFAMGLSLSGVVSFGERLAGAGGQLVPKHGVAGAFFTGMLATVVATPCTAPFMGAAMGLALVAPAPLAVGIFVAVGLGLAAPYLLATLVPGWQRVLPRPGAWMELVKQLLAFPLYATVAWLIWVLVQEVGPGESLMALFGLVLVGFAAWVYGRTRLAAPLARRLGIGLAVGGTAAACVLAASLTGAGGAAASASAPAARDGIPYQAFSPSRLEALKSAGTPVFVNLTAAWCVTCLVNERVVLDREAVRRAFAAHGIAALKGDWTRQDPDITRLLQDYGRSGVPLYLLYDKQGRVQILPQLLTETGVLAAIGRI